MTDELPLFPLNTVLFPGQTLQLHVFEERYRALVRHLLTVSDKSQRLFGVLAIRHGHEVGAQGAQSMHRVGCVVQMTSVAPAGEGSFDIEVVGRERFHLRSLDSSGAYLVGTVETASDAGDPSARAGAESTEADRTRSTFAAYREKVSQVRGADMLDGTLPNDSVYLSYTLAATCLLSLPQRQELLEIGSADERLAMLRHLMREEMRAMQAIPSLPATEVSRTAWSPN